MGQEIYLPQRPSLERIAGVYHVSSLFLLCGVAVFCVIALIALRGFFKVLLQLKKIAAQKRAMLIEMDLFYQKQLKLLHGKQFFLSLSQYAKLLVQLGKGKDVHAIWHMLGYTQTDIRTIENIVQ